MNKAAFLVLPAVIAFAIVGGCKQDEKPQSSSSPKAMSDMAAESAVAKVGPSKGAATQPANQNVTGTLTFVQEKEGVHITGEFTGLSPGKHGFHIHEKGDLSDPNLQSVGPHYNPGHTHHGDATGENRHAGDLGNLVADDAGKASYDKLVSGLKVSDLVGRSVIIHAKEDDVKTDPSGNSGGRIAGGVIELSQ